MKELGFIHVLETLSPRLDSVVLAGGWAWYLYRKYLTGARALPSEFTVDVDFVTPRTLQKGSPGLAELLAAGGFESLPQGDERPPVTHNYWPSYEAPQAELEFLTPARGPGEQATLEVAGVIAQQLRYLDLLLDDPLHLDIEEEADRRRFAGSVLIPRVGRYVWQKALSFPSRRPKGKKRTSSIFSTCPTRRGA